MVAGRLIALTMALLIFFVLGSWAGDWINPRRSPPRPPSQVGPPEADSEAKGSRPPAGLDPTDPRQPEPRAVAARAAAIHRDATAIEAECRRAAGGDWEKWQKDTELYRKAIKARIDALKSRPFPEEGFPECRYEPLPARDDFPLCQVGPRERISYLYEPASLAEFRRSRQVVAAHRWLKQRGVDLVLIPIPNMGEVYVEHFVSPCPADGIIGPHVRQTLLELLKEDVEVVDASSLFRSLRDTDGEYLYNAADPHWAPRAMRIMAKEIADRLTRYKFGARARYGLPIVQARREPFILDSEIGGIRAGFWNVLSPEQQARAEPAQTKEFSQVYVGKDFIAPDDANSQVLVIGHSFVLNFREQLAKESNLLVRTIFAPNYTTEAFASFLREPEVLEHTRVVVWVTTEQHMTAFKPLPKPIMDTLTPAASTPAASPAPGRPSPP
jgi:SGNH hydrolase-like domain, acetyltransferase AlgX